MAGKQEAGGNERGALGVIRMIGNRRNQRRVQDRGRRVLLEGAVNLEGRSRTLELFMWF